MKPINISLTDDNSDYNYLENKIKIDEFKNLFLYIAEEMKNVSLDLTYRMGKETVELRLPAPYNDNVFGAIQICRPKDGPYIELRFYRKMLDNYLLSHLDELTDKPFRIYAKRKDGTINPNPESIKFKFQNLCPNTKEYISKIKSIIISKGI